MYEMRENVIIISYVHQIAHTNGAIQISLAVINTEERFRNDGCPGLRQIMK